MGFKLVPSLAVAVVLGVWAAGAEAQQIEGYEPISVSSGATSSTYRAHITLQSPSTFTVKLRVYKNGVQKHISTTLVPNPGTTTPTFTKVVSMTSWPPVGGDLLDYHGELWIGGVLKSSHHWYVTVSGGTRPTTYVEPARGWRTTVRFLLKEEEILCG